MSPASCPDCDGPSARPLRVLAVTTDVRPDVAMMPAGWQEANANLLIDGERRDPITGFPAFRSGVCRIERVDTASG